MLTGVTTVVLSLGTTPDAVVATARSVPGDVVHVVRTDVLGADGVAVVRTELARPVMATVGVDGPDAVARATELAGVADYLLLDSRHPAPAWSAPRATPTTGRSAPRSCSTSTGR